MFHIQDLPFALIIFLAAVLKFPFISFIQQVILLELKS